MKQGADGNFYINAAHLNSNGKTTLTGTAQAGDTIVVTNGSVVVGKTTAGASNSWSLSTSVTNGQSYSYTATATDAAGNTASSAPFNFTVDTSAPTDNVKGETIVLNNSINSPSVTLSGTASVGVASVLVNGQQAGLSSTGGWSYTDSKLTGSNAFKATATDVAGNTSTVSGST